MERYVEGVTRPEWDDRVSKVIAKIPTDSGGNTMLWAVRNDDGEIYREFTSTGMGSMFKVVGAMQKLDFTDELEGNFSPNKYDGIFRRDK
ncbi:hypothetical protein [Ferrimonas balearica]|uniref:hypothetical protein n=1 Tax=Ferrimonas balearica TaxID=44012 RepID=UPI001C99C154|nr:hypothetical protein [Ferrimonas balearica]MBY5920406.1 hypothetical protein [Ferrimonas balearica]MBY5996909.1 hypothetical protein [Ferrimonas balearica]